MQVLRAAVVAVAGALVPPVAGAAESIPDGPGEFLAGYCVGCHAGAGAPEGIRLDAGAIDWDSRQSVVQWERVYGAVAEDRMPPAAAPSPTESERERLLGWLEPQLTRHSAIGSAVPRRLNREEYRNTIRGLFGIPDFALPAAFPADDSSNGFDNVGEGLILSPPLMAQYLEVANAVADRVLPPVRGPAVAVPRRYSIGPVGLSTTGGGPVDNGPFRIVSSRNMASAAAWPTHFEAAESGLYRLEIQVAAFESEGMFYEARSEPFRIAVYARPKTDQVYAALGEIRQLAEFEIRPGTREPQALSADVVLFRGEVFGIHWDDGPAHSDPPRRELSRSFLADRLERDRLFYAAMLEFAGGPRGTTQVQAYEAMRALMDSGTLDLSDPRLDKLPEVWGGGLSNAPHNWIKHFVYEELHRFGPAIDILGIDIEGPLRLVEDDEARARKEVTRRFLGNPRPDASDRERAKAVLGRFLPLAFRRSVPDDRIQAYVDLAAGHLAANPAARLEDGLHLAVRRALVSPNFLYRGLRAGPLDDYDLASRLSYFLASAPPDERLAGLARERSLSDPEALAGEARRLLASPSSDAFVSSFTGQWLSTRLLRDIMPDPRLLFFADSDREAMIEETELFFAEILRRNLPVATFVDPGFSYRSARLNKFYGGDLQGPEMRRVTFERGGPHGGILGLASTMMATANGVDTHPVLRGVWVLENVLGTPPPEPPPDVPAIAPDTSGATTMRDQLAAHRADASCARCHDLIDPLGMALENFDPVGRWRDHYPVYTRPFDGAAALEEEFYSTVGKGTSQGPVVDSVGFLANGSRILGPVGLKRYVLEELDTFSRCLAGKLLVYATGRPLGFRDERVLDAIVSTAKAKGNGFRDLVVAVVQSESFRIR